MSKMFNRAKMTITSTGTGALTLGVAPIGYQTFASSGVANGDTVSYTIEDGANWEVGTGVYTASGTTLSRTVTQSYNGSTYGTSPISVTTNAAVFITALAADIAATAAVAGMTTGSVPFVSSGSLSQDNSNLFWDSANNRLGIGLNNPVHPLHVNKSQNAPTAFVISNYTSGASASSAFILQGGTLNSSLQGHLYDSSGSPYVVFQAGSAVTGFYHDCAQHIFRNAAGSEYARIDSSGRLGVGVTSPTYKLDVSGTGHITGALTLDTALAVTSGGTGVTTSTGSGNNVLSTSPTLVTPVLGTPTSVTLTNATGLPLSTGVTGTLPVANGGTGLTSLTAGYIPYGNGTGALASSANLFWDSTNKRIGIGTSSPSQSIDVVAGATENAYFRGYNGTVESYFGVSYGLTAVGLGSGSSHPVVMFTAGSEKMRITSAGDVGIGTSSPGAKLDVNGALKVATSNWLSFGSDNTFYSDASYGLIIKAPATSNFIAFRSSDDTERMRLNASGNLGLGTTSPSNRLQVVNGNASQIRVSEQTLAYYYDFGRDNSDGYFSINGNQGLGYKWLINGTERMRIDSSGNVGVGTTSPVNVANYKSITLNGSTGSYLVMQSNGSTILSIYGDTGSAGIFNAYASSVLIFGASNSEGMRLDTVNNLLVGTTTANATKLTVNGPAAFAPPSTKTGNYSLAAADHSLIFNGSGTITLTLQAASSYPGRMLYVKTIAAQTVVSASSNVAPIGSATAGTAILAATAGKWAILQSDGTNWIIMSAN